MGNNIVLGNLSKTQEIGDSIKEINNSFKILDELLTTQKESQQDIDTFCSFIEEMFDELKFSYEFIKDNRFYFYDLWDEVLEKKELFLKPIVCLYPQKIRSDVSIIDQNYIENLLYEWVIKNYIITSNSKNKPEYIEGQKIIIYYVLAQEKIEQSLENLDISTTKCITKDVEVVVNCNSRRSGQACFDGCGCVSCSRTVKCSNKGTLNCFYTDSYTQRNGVERYLRGITSYLFEEYPDSSFGYVTFIVNDCEWKLQRVTGLKPEETKERRRTGLITPIDRNLV
jgi:hypothetical protein